VNTIKTLPSITWPDPSPLKYGTPLSNKQLNAKASVPGTFVYNPTFGATLPIGTSTLSVTFTPTDEQRYFSNTKTVALVINQIEARSSNPSKKSYKGPVLEVIDFDSIHDVHIENHGSTTVFVTDILITVDSPDMIKGFTPDLTIRPNHIEAFHMGDLKYPAIASVERLGDTWDMHYAKTLERYGSCGIQLVFYSSDAPPLIQMVDYLSKHGKGLPVKPVEAVLHYRVEGSRQIIEQPISIVAVVMANRACQTSQPQVPAHP
jgi:hypothetical protein